MGRRRESVVVLGRRRGGGGGEVEGARRRDFVVVRSALRDSGSLGETECRPIDRRGNRCQVRPQQFARHPGRTATGSSSRRAAVKEADRRGSGTCGSPPPLLPRSTQHLCRLNRFDGVGRRETLGADSVTSPTSRCPRVVTSRPRRAGRRWCGGAVGRLHAADASRRSPPTRRNPHVNKCGAATRPQLARRGRLPEEPR